MSTITPTQLSLAELLQRLPKCSPTLSAPRPVLHTVTAPKHKPDRAAPLPKVQGSRVNLHQPELSVADSFRLPD